jgi:hypothetical protein
MLRFKTALAPRLLGSPARCGGRRLRRSPTCQPGRFHGRCHRNLSWNRIGSVIQKLPVAVSILSVGLYRLTLLEPFLFAMPSKNHQSPVVTAEYRTEIQVVLPAPVQPHPRPSVVGIEV